MKTSKDYVVRKKGVKFIGSWEYEVGAKRLVWSEETKLLHGVPINYEPHLGEALGFYHPDSREKIQYLVEHLIDDHESYDTDARIVTRDKKDIWVRTTGIVLESDGENVKKIGGTFEDVTKEYLKIHRLEGYWGVLNEVNMLTISDINGVIRFVNQNFCDLTGYSRKDIIGKTHNVFNSGYHSKEFFKDLWMTILSGRTWDGEILNRNKGGKLQWIHTTIYPLKDLNGNVIEFVSIRKDITQDKIDNRKSFKDKKQRAIAEIGGQVLHEVMSPLTLLNSYIEKLENLSNKGVKEEYKEELNETLTSIRKSSNQVIDTFRGMRDLLTEEENFEEVDINTLCRKAHFVTHLEMQRAKISFHMKADKKLPKLYLNRPQLVQVLTNLLTNAIHAVKNLEDKWIKIKISHDNKNAYIRIIDSGLGIDPDLRDKIFETLFTTKREDGGTGFGLAISKRLINRLNGSLDIDLDCTNTCFLITLPLD